MAAISNTTVVWMCRHDMTRHDDERLRQLIENHEHYTAIGPGR